MSLPLEDQDHEELRQDLDHLCRHSRARSLTIRADGTATSTALQGQGTPSGFENEKDTSVIWDLTLAQAK